MPHRSDAHPISRRALLGSTALAAAGSLAAASAEPADQPPSPATIRDRFWIYTVAAGLDNNSLELGGVRRLVHFSANSSMLASKTLVDNMELSPSSAP